VSRIAFAAMTAVAAGVAFVFLLLPLIAIFLRVPIGDLFDQFSNQVFRDALVVSLKTSLIAHVSVLLFGTPTAYLLARKRFFGRGALITLIELPLVLPPAVAGIALLAAFGRLGLLGDELTRSASASASRRRRSSSPSRSSRAPSTCGGRSRPSKASIRT
jgi:molybdate transport system permease protein